MPLIPQADAIAFDLEDTLCNHQEAQTNALRFVAAIASKHRSRQESFLAAYRLNEPRLYRAALSSMISVEDYRRKRFQVAFAMSGIPFPEEKIGSLNRTYAQRCNEEARIFPETLGVIQQLHALQVPLAIITNGPSEGQRTKISALGIGRYFSAVLISAEERVAKPDARIYIRAAESLGVDVSGILMVGDSLKDDYHGALNAGAQAVLLDREGRASGQEGIAVIHNLRELLA